MKGITFEIIVYNQSDEVVIVYQSTESDEDILKALEPYNEKLTPIINCMTGNDYEFRPGDLDKVTELTSKERDRFYKLLATVQF